MEKAPVQQSRAKANDNQKSHLSTNQTLRKPNLVNNSLNQNAGYARHGSFNHLLHLQGQLGNRAVGRLLQAKLTVSRPDDPYEREADQVADSVMRMSESEVSENEEIPIQSKPLASRITPLVQREVAVGEEEAMEAEPVLQREALEGIEDREESVQPKWVSGSRPTVQRQEAEEYKEEEPVQARSFVHRQAEEEDELAQTKPMGHRLFASMKTPIQPKGMQAQTPHVSPAIAANIHGLEGRGSPLPQATRAFFEPRFGVDFKHVRVHTDSRAAEAANSIQAKAFTVGKNIAFGIGRYAPHSHSGRQLLAHELAHVVQQNGSRLLRTHLRAPSHAFQVATSLGPHTDGVNSDELASRRLDEGRMISRKSNNRGNSRKARLNFLSTTRAMLRCYLGQPVVMRRGPDPETGEMDAQLEPPKEHMDAFLASRVDLFHVVVVGDEYAVVVDRKSNPWTERYTPRALAEAAMAALVRKVSENPPPAMDVQETVNELLEPKGRHRLRVPEVLSPVMVSPFWQVSVDQGTVEAVTEQMGLTLSDEGRKLQRSAEMGSFLEQALRQVAQNFGSVRPHLPTKVLEEAGITDRHVFNMLMSDGTRRAASELAKPHKLARPLIKGRDLAASTGQTDVFPDWTGLPAAQWAQLVADLAVDIAKRAGSAALEREERERRHQLNEQLRPHELDVGITKALAFILNNYDPDSSVTVNLLGDVVIEGGQRITNAKGETLFILRAGASQVIYQNLSDRKFYRQSTAGIESELRYGVFALVTEKTKHIIPVTKFMFRLLGVIFPPVGAVMLASTVLNVAYNVAEHEDALKSAYDNMRIIQANIEGLVPGVTEAVIELVLNNLDDAAVVLLDPKYAEVAWDEWLIVVVDYAVAALGGSGADVAGKAVVGLLKKTWAIVKKVAGALVKALKHAYKVGRPVVVGAARGGKDWDLERAKKAAAELEGIGLVDALSLAIHLVSLEEDELDQLIDELKELSRVGSDLLATVERVFAW